jgi:hypothetical protein
VIRLYGSTIICLDDFPSKPASEGLIIVQGKNIPEHASSKLQLTTGVKAINKMNQESFINMMATIIHMTKCIPRGLSKVEETLRNCLEAGAKMQIALSRGTWTEGDMVHSTIYLLQNTIQWIHFILVSFTALVIIVLGLNQLIPCPFAL